MTNLKSCPHKELQFGSGDYYLFCLECGRTWAMMGNQPEYGKDAEGKNIGACPENMSESHPEHLKLRIVPNVAC